MILFLWAELALDGTIRQIAGVLPMILHARDIGRKNIVIPAGNCAEGRLVDGIDVLIPASLLELVEHLRGERFWMYWIRKLSARQQPVSMMWILRKCAGSR